MDKNNKRKITFKNTIAWILGSLFLLTGIITLIQKPLGGILFILASIVILPPVYSLISNKLNLHLSKSMRILIFIILVTLAGVSTNEKTIDLATEESDTNVVSTVDVESTEENNTVSESKVKNPSPVIETKKPIQQAKNYQEIFTFSGKDIKKSEPFTITGNRFKIKYDCQGDLCQAFLYKTKNNSMDSLIMNSTESANDETVIYGSGEYYIDVNSMGSWSFVVEDYK